MKKHFLITIFFVMSFAQFLLGSSSNPTMSRIQGDQYTQGIADTQPAGALGTLVPTGVFGTNGSLNIAAQVPNCAVRAMQVLPNGTIPVCANDGTNSYVLEYMANGDVNTSFASGTGNVLELTGYAQASRFMTVDEQSRLLLSGSADGSSLPWISRIMPTGIVDTNFAFVDGASWTTTGAINQLATQTLGQIVAVGSNGTNAMLARYNLDGSIDTSFGLNGYVIFNGSASGSGTLPVATVAINNLVIDSLNNIYVAYVDATPSVNVIRLTPLGFVDGSWNFGTPVNMSYLYGSSMQTDQLAMIVNSLGDLVVAVPSGSPTVIKAASITLASGAAGTFADFTTSGGVFGTDNYALFNMMATSDGNVYFVGSDTTTLQMAVICCTATGILDDGFNNGTGVNFFYPSGSQPSNYSIIYSGAIAPDGQIYVGGSVFDFGIIYPYLSSLYNHQYVSSVLQYPLTQEQGTQDLVFGSVETQTNPGVVTPFVGLYRSSLMQKAESVIELTSGNILLGMSGYLGTSPLLSNMMLIRLLPSGLVDGTFGTSGQLILPNITGTNEYLTSLLEDGSGNIYLTGYSDVGAIFRKYTASGMLIWNSDYVVSGYQGLGCGFENLNRTLLYLAGPGTTGQINAYVEDTGAVDTTFNPSGTIQGELLTTDYGLEMGPLYNGIVDSNGNIFVGYKNTSTGTISVVSIVNSARGINWNIQDVYGTTGIDADNVRLSFNQDGNVVVAASSATNFLITVLDVATGLPTADYPTPLVISCGTTIAVEQVMGISDNTIVVIGYDETGTAMLAARINDQGEIDITFDSQGALPGVAMVHIGNQIAGYYARVASAITVQSHTGSNQGNLIMSGYEQMFATDSTPMVMRLFGEPGTTQVPNNPRTITTPGSLDPTYNPTGTPPGIAQTEVTATTPLNQEVRAIRQAFAGTQIMTVITDQNTSISYTQRLNSDSSVDTTYSSSGDGIAIVQMTGTELLQSMVYDGQGNMLVTGSNSLSGGYVKRILSTGAMDQTFGGPNGSTISASYPVGTTYGLMDVVNACQQLTNGNIVIVGAVGGVGTVQMIGSTGLLVSSFGTSGSVSSGINITSVSVDPSNNIYASVVYDAGSQLNARIIKLNSAGQFVTSFGVNGVVDAALSDIDGGDSLRLVFDNFYRPIVAASFGGISGQVAVQRYNADGSVDTSFNGGSATILSFTPDSNIFVTGLVALQNNKTLVSGYLQDTTTPDNNVDFLACLDDVGAPDTSFSVSATPGVVLFYATLITQLARPVINMNVQTNGRILLCGGELPIVDQEVPLTFRFNGYADVQPVPQYTGYQPTPNLPIVLNTAFNPNGAQPGIAESPTISGLLHLGNIAVDSIGNAVIGGTTADGYFAVARYLRNGLLDTVANGGIGFGTDGIFETTIPVDGLSGGYLALDTADNVYVGGVMGSNQFILIRLLQNGTLDPAFGTDGVTVSPVISHLYRGGYLTIDSLRQPVISGYTTDGNIVVTRFTTLGGIDPDFAIGTGNVASVAVAGLASGGSIARDPLDNLYIGGMTSSNTMFIVMLDAFGVLHHQFGDNGIATTGTGSISSALVNGGALALDSNNNLGLGGLTVDQTFVVARFTPDGVLDPLFNPTGTVAGIAYSDPVNVLNIFGNIAINSSDDIVVGGTASNYDGTKSMIVANFTSSGALNTTFTSVGMATTGEIADLALGGVVATDIYDNIYVGGLSNLPGFIVAQMLSGQEIFIDDTATLNPQDLKTYYYGNDPLYLDRVLSAIYFARVITNQTVKDAVLTSVAETLALYVAEYSGQPGWNLVWHLYRQLSVFEKNREALLILFADSTNEINDFYAQLEQRINNQRFSS